MGDNAVGKTINLAGSTVVIISPQDISTVSFTWDSETPENPTETVKIIADYIETQDGDLVRSPRRRQEKLWWLINFGPSPDGVVDGSTRVDLSDCDMNQPCTCLSFAAYGISYEGYLVQLTESVLLSFSLGYSTPS